MSASSSVTSGPINPLASASSLLCTPSPALSSSPESKNEVPLNPPNKGVDFSKITDPTILAQIAIAAREQLTKLTTPSIAAAPESKTDDEKHQALLNDMLANFKVNRANWKQALGSLGQDSSGKSFSPSPFTNTQPTNPRQNHDHSFLNYTPAHFFPLDMYTQKPLAEVLAQTLDTSSKRKFLSILQWKKQIHKLIKLAPHEHLSDWLTFLDDGQKVFNLYQLSGLNYYHFELFQALRAKVITSPADPGYAAKLLWSLESNQRKNNANQNTNKGRGRFNNKRKRTQNSGADACTIHPYATHTNAVCFLQQGAKNTTPKKLKSSFNNMTPKKPFFQFKGPQ
jgi:hypothetical protein